MWTRVLNVPDALPREAFKYLKGWKSATTRSGQVFGRAFPVLSHLSLLQTTELQSNCEGSGVQPSVWNEQEVGITSCQSVTNIEGQ